MSDFLCLDPAQNVYSGDKDGEPLYIFQPRPEHREAVTRAQDKCSERTLRGYRQRGAQRRRKKGPTSVCDLPLHRRGQPGILQLMLARADGEIIGFSYTVLKKARLFSDNFFKIPDPEALTANFNLCIVDSEQRRGYGSFFAEASQFVARDFGARWMVGVTAVKGGTLGIRMRQNWEVVALHEESGNNFYIRKRLV